MHPEGYPYDPSTFPDNECGCTEKIDDALEKQGFDWRVTTALMCGGDPPQLSVAVLLGLTKKYGSKSRKSAPSITCLYCPICGVKRH